MTDKQKLEIALDALRDISKYLVSLAEQGTRTKDEALRLFSETFELVATISESAQQQITLQ